MSNILLVVDAAAPAEAIAADLKSIGMHVIGAVQCDRLVQESLRLGPDLVVVHVGLAQEVLFAATAQLAVLQSVPVLAFTSDTRPASLERAFASGMHAWVVRGYAPDRLAPLLQLAQLRHRQEAGHRAALAQLAERLESRKLVERAKGVLMSGAGLPEEAAFRTLRNAAMDGKQPMGQVAQRLLDAARYAEAVNRAGQLRMLSQRLMKLYLLELLQVEPAGARALREATSAHAAANLLLLGELAQSGNFGDLLARTATAWRAFADVVASDGEPSAPVPALQAMDAASEQVLACADQLTAALERASPAGRLHWVNLSGRQRMLAQRYAKVALMSEFLAQESRAVQAGRLREIGTAFVTALQEMRDSSVTPERGRDLIARAHDNWNALVEAAQHAGQLAGRREIARSSEELLAQLDALTQLFEHHAQVLIG
jgi:AmiR/NasT family two-component response regulator